jgi:diguanylate cyclase (GGDEF)-like protein
MLRERAGQGMEGPLKIAEDIERVPRKKSARRRAAKAPSSEFEAFARQTGLGEEDLSPVLRAGIAELLGEIDRLRVELETAKARAAHLERLADEDALMPVANRRAFMRELSRLVALAQRYDSESSVVYLDLNGMKGINDHYGHNAGDAALQHVARILIDNTRHADVVGRLGGDEFGVLLVKTDQRNADEKAAALAQAIEQQPLIWEGAPIHLSAAFGAHCFTGKESAVEAISVADRAMYRAKHSRRVARG